jgi:hypothetical protein
MFVTEHYVHRDQESQPMEGLRPNHPQSSFGVVNPKPSSGYADKPGRHSKKLPIADERLMRIAASATAVRLSPLGTFERTDGDTMGLSISWFARRQVLILAVGGIPSSVEASNTPTIRRHSTRSHQIPRIARSTFKFPSLLRFARRMAALNSPPKMKMEAIM